MRAVVYDAYGATPEVCEMAEPSCPADGVVVRVEATGVCRSDWHAWRGHDPVPLPMVPGHELAGHVVAVGGEVRRWQVGDRVTVPFVVGCGRCPVCSGGDAQVCPHQEQPGFTMPGSFAELVALPAADANLVALPEEVDMVSAAALGCRFATAYRALHAHGRVRADEWVAVHGCGGVGLSAVMVAAAAGARVVAVDVRADALELARRVGAEATLGADPDLGVTSEAVRDLTDGGAHVSLDAVGSRTTAEASVRSLRRRGRHVQAGLLLGADSSPVLPMDRVVAWELSLHGTHGMAAHEYPPMLAAVAEGILRPDLLVGRTVTLDEAPGALTSLGTDRSPAGITVVQP
ncbi:alcohol dehydrogenase catalytic domain-containing protein [Nocardioides acrostichi]|uniref:Alcohol dehydrogenase catalytic domain-containing protein n=1 Tax=Nocardioides acrostichi TaxID=2784339 RepID=A0A930V1W7_9ACTN|nr:alcohol dehydrogenase catalytic domain-containing protein [Nocardioides acrostichi]MBF4162257.1 alcohol dehydrogenase catalytic domain-containing protein [Nocardioides acrostichi]